VYDLPVLICQFVVGVFHLPASTRSCVDRFRAPPSGFKEQGVSPLQPRLLELLRSVNFGGGAKLTADDLEGIGITLRLLPTPIPADASAEERKRRTAPQQGRAIAGAVVQVLPQHPVRATYHHALHIRYCATIEEEQDCGFMRFLILGQIKFMACQSAFHSTHQLSWQHRSVSVR
jgi:hypothetical protein